MKKVLFIGLFVIALYVVAQPLVRPANIAMHFAPASGDAVSLTDGLVSHWKMDETSGTTANDSAGNNDGTMGGGLSAANDSVTGAVDTAIKLDGTNDFIVISYVSAFNPASFSISFWIKGPTGSASGQVMGLPYAASSSNSWSWAFEFNGVDTLNFAVDDTADNIYNRSASIPNNTWTHIIGIYDDTAGTVAIYKNNSLAESGSLPNTRSGPTGSPDLTIGAYDQWGGGGYADIAIDDVRFYNRALNASERTALYNLGS